MSKTNRTRKQNMAGVYFIIPSFLGVSIFVLFPFLDVVRRSFVTAVNETWVGLANYKMVIENSAFRLAAGNTLRFVGVCIPVLVVLSLLTAVFLYSSGKIADFLKSAFLIPMAIPVASVVLLWKVLFHGQGMLNGFMDKLGFTPVDWMNTKYAFWVLVFSYIWKNLGYDIILWIAGLSAIPSSIYEAARVDGAGNIRIFFSITIPNLLPTLYTITVLSFLNSFKVFREGYLVAGDYPHESMYLLQHTFNNWFRDLSFDKIAAGAVLVAIVILILVTLLEKAWNQKES
ncbi:MAG TPA: sugar ABC transporter permease [Candidatus Pelethocola excrementipullorum]|nr:sugar ABC transporter permease [Candidatus Pelethocola excrementipullorum]